MQRHADQCAVHAAAHPGASGARALLPASLLLLLLALLLLP